MIFCQKSQSFILSFFILANYAGFLPSEVGLSVKISYLCTLYVLRRTDRL